MATPVENQPSESLRRENAELTAALAEARRDNRSYRNLLLAAAHEMRTPLHAIGLHLEMLARLSSGGKESALKAQIERAKRVLAGYVRRTSMLLDAARVTGGAFTLNREPVALGEVVTSVTELYAAKADFQEARVDVRVEPGLVGQWDRAAVETILANIVSNALKYGEGAPLVISAAADDAGNVVFQVADSGPGIAANQRGHIFEKFNRAPDSTVAGYGLGLWIADQLARLHGGSIALAPTSVGSTFIVRLPMTQSPSGRSSA